MNTSMKVIKSCGHTFCRDCLKKNANKLQCPECKVDYNKIDIKLCSIVNESNQLISKLLKLIEQPMNLSKEERICSYTKTVECLSNILTNTPYDTNTKNKKGKSKQMTKRKKLNIKPVQNIDTSDDEPPILPIRPHNTRVKNANESISSVKLCTPKGKRILMKSNINSTNSINSNKSSVKSKKILRKISKIEKRNMKGETPLHVACIKGNLELVKKLIDQGANTNTMDNNKWTPLHEVCQHGYVDIAEALLGANAEVNVPGYDNDTPLHDAVRNRHLSCVRLLIAMDANKEARNRNGQTPISLADNETMRLALQPSSNLDSSRIAVTPRKVPLVDNTHFTILLTGVSSIKRRSIEKVSSIINSTFTNTFSPEVTHIVSMVNEEGKCPRTEKYLKGLLCGKWILRLDWLEACIQAGHRLPEENFEIISAVSSSKTRQNMGVPKKGRVFYTQQHKPPLFDGCSFYLKGTFDKECVRDIVENIINIGGGTLLKRLPKAGQCGDGAPYHSEAGGQLQRCSTYVIIGGGGSPTTPEEEVRMDGAQLCFATTAWVLECVASLKLLEPTDYMQDEV